MRRIMTPPADAARRLGYVSTHSDVATDDQEEHDRWFDTLLAKLGREPRGRRGAAWARVVDEAPTLDNLEPGELSELMRDAEPATDDDVPWRFPVRTPLEESR